jgi:hypothetical protein
MPLAPIVLFVYNRPWHTEQTLNALAANDLADESVLYIYADGPKNDSSIEVLENIKKTRDIIKRQKWCKAVYVIESEINKGLANSIIQGVTDVVNKHGKIIVLEDDLVTHPFFLTYMNEYLNVYENNDSVISIHGYMYPVKKEIKTPFFIKGADCWGWATWKRGWDLFEYNSKLLLDKLLKANQSREFNFNNTYNYTSLLKAEIEGKVDSWAIRWYASAFLLDKLTLYPPVSLVQNIGHDGSGTHKDNFENKASKTFNFKNFELKEIEVSEDNKVKRQIEVLFRGNHNFIRKITQKIKFILSDKKSISYE